LSFISLGSEYGNYGHWENATSSCGWLHTADQLAQRSLPHPARCAQCDNDEKTINNLYITCVFAHQFWFSLLQRVIACMFSHSSLKKHPLISGLVHDAVVSQALQGLSFPHNFMSMVALQTL
jgi:hypothetical protein